MRLIILAALILWASPESSAQRYMPHRPPNRHKVRYSFTEVGPLKYFDHPGASAFTRQGLSRNPQSAMDAARDRIGLPRVKRDSRLDRIARDAWEVYRKTGQVHTLDEPELRALGWPVDVVIVPNPRPTWRHNYSEVVGASAGYFNELLDWLVQGVETQQDDGGMEPHAGHFDVSWTHWGYYEEPSGDGNCLWMGYLPKTMTKVSVADPVTLAVNTARIAVKSTPMTRDPRLDRAAAYSLSKVTVVGNAYQVHCCIDEAAKVGGWPKAAVRPVWSKWENYTEGFGGGTLDDYLKFCIEIVTKIPDEGHAMDFRRPWTHFGFAKNSMGCVLFYGILP